MSFLRLAVPAERRKEVSPRAGELGGEHQCARRLWTPLSRILSTCSYVLVRLGCRPEFILTVLQRLSTLAVVQVIDTRS